MYFKVILLGFLAWRILLRVNPRIALKKRIIKICILFTLFIVFYAAMIDVQSGIMSSVNQVLMNYASY